jgi:hypothetical protein
VSSPPPTRAELARASLEAAGAPIARIGPLGLRDVSGLSLLPRDRPQESPPHLRPLSPPPDATDGGSLRPPGRCILKPAGYGEEIPCPPGSGCGTPPGVRIDEGSTTEVSSFGHDPRLAGVGADPWRGTGQTYMPIPSDGLVGTQYRYFYRLAAISIDMGQELYIEGYRQGVKIGYAQPSATGDEPTYVEIDQQTPWWKYPDGNISWHITVQRGLVRAFQQSVPGMPPGMSSDLYGIAPALLAPFPPLTPSAYVPLNAGVPPGDGVGSLGNFWELRGPLYSQAVPRSLGYLVPGPAVVAMWATVRQTVPLRRGRAAPPAVNGTFLPVEDQFLAAYPNAVYTAIAGSLLVRVRSLPC